MQRELLQSLIKWKKNDDRKPLIIRGARQVGKTWLMKEFGNKHCEIEHAISDQQGNIYFTGFIENKINNIDKNLYIGKLSGNGDVVLRNTRQCSPFARDID